MEPSISGRCEQPRFSHVRTIKGHARAIASCKFSPGAGTMLATASADKTAKLWDVSSGDEIRTLPGHEFGISDIAWSPAGNYLCTASDDHTLKFWDVETGKCLRTLTGHTNFVFCCNFSPQGHLLASGSFDETLRVWDVRTGHCLREVPAHSDPVTAVDFSADGTLIVTSSLDGLCRLWDTQTGHCLKTLYGRDSPPMSFVRFTPNGQYILSSSLDGSMQLWDYEKAKAVKTYQGHTNKQFCVYSAFCTPQGVPRAVRKAKAPEVPEPWVITGSEDGSIFVYGLNSQQVLQTFGKEAAADGQAADTQVAPMAVDGAAPTANGSADACAGASTGEAKEGGKEGGKDGARAGSAGAEASPLNAVLCVDVHPERPLLASCGRYREHVVKLWEHSS